MSSRLVPQLVSTLQSGYSRADFGRDLLAGLIVGVVALPLAIAFAIASGVKPEQGLYTAIIAGFLISLLSGSKVQIGGPTGAFIVVVFAIVTKFGYGGLAVATVMAGVMLILMGVMRLGGVIKFIPYPMTVGFTSGIALIIATTQVKDFLGLQMATPPAEFAEKLIAYGEHIGGFSPVTTAISIGSLATILFWPKVTRKLPGSLVAIILSTVAVQLFDLPVATVGSAFGAVPDTLPKLTIPHFEWSMLRELFPAALTIALLGAIESLLSAVVADGMIGDRHRSNMELVGQGVANLVTPFFGGIPATGAIARTATNIKNGAASPVAGMIHALALLLILLVFGRWASLIPMATLAAILLMVSYHMSEWRHFVKLFRSPRPDVLVMLVTFFLTVFVDLTVAIETGVVLSALLFMHRMSVATEIRHVQREVAEEFDPEDAMSIGRREIPAGVEVFEVHGPFFFGAANQFKDTLSIVDKPPKVLILRMRHVLSIDATALHALEEVIAKCRRNGTVLVLSGISNVMREKLKRAGVVEEIGEGNIYPHIDAALEGAARLVWGASK